MKAFLEENSGFLIGARVQKIQQPNRRELIFQLRGLKETRKFYVNINPSFYHICFMSKGNEAARAIEIPKQAAMFCMLLRKYLDGAKIVDVVQPKHERIIEFYFDYYDVLNENSKLCLAIELMGKHSNVILYNADTNVIIGCAHNVGAEKSKERELAGLLPYIYPPKKRKKSINKIDFEVFNLILSAAENKIDAIINSFYDITKPIIESVLKNGFSFENPQELFIELQKTVELYYVEPSISEDFSCFSIYPVAGVNSVGTVNNMLDDYFSFYQAQTIIRNLKQRLLTILNNNLKKLNRLKSKQQYQLDQIDKANYYKKIADIIMANLYRIKSFEKSVTLLDYEIGENVEIDLDTTLSASDNANRYYKLYKKMKSAYEHSVEMIKETQTQIDYYSEQKFYVELASSINELNDIAQEILPAENKKSKESEIKVESREFAGFKVYVGKNSKQNDYILSKLSSPEDLWFHSLNMAGAHVVIKKNAPKESVPNDVLLVAAQLAKKYSVQKSGAKIPVIYTKRKYVKKSNSKGLAFVTYKNESEIYC